MNAIELKINPAKPIDYTVDYAVQLAKLQNAVVSFKFDGIMIVVDPSSDQEQVLRDWEKIIQTQKQSGSHKKL